MFLCQSTSDLDALPHLLTFHPRALRIALPVQHDQVGIRARAQRAFLVLDPKALGGIVCRALEGFAEGAAGEAREVANTFVEGHDTVCLYEIG